MPTLQDSKYKHRTFHYYDEDSQLILCGQPKKKRNIADSSYYVTCLDCISIMRERAIPLQWDTHSMIDQARSLQHAAEHLFNRPEAQSPEKDSLPFLATFRAAPLLLAFAIELALKAFICSERPGPPPRIHDLFDLHEALQSNTQTFLNTQFLILHPHLADPFFHLDLPDQHFPHRPTKTRFQVILKEHRHLFEHWRYIDPQNLPLHINSSSLNNVLNLLIQTFDQGWAARKSSFDFPPE